MAGMSSEGRWSPSFMDTRIPRGVTNAWPQRSPMIEDARLDIGCGLEAGIDIEALNPDWTTVLQIKAYSIRPISELSASCSRYRLERIAISWYMELFESAIGSRGSVIAAIKPGPRAERNFTDRRFYAGAYKRNFDV
ncbi:hypothetical protein EVAR_96728_1 [Eumeta japonica]|uniref:Uncharacterized protein n=1 Tax=Eumeta variegata TaxID=151549 RepID=A0A4C1SQX5_EUMVA|nr:hypothetical protein EVAR_96728_1 [Eumeta japonica]